jgi:hypothetical protein
MIMTVGSPDDIEERDPQYLRMDAKKNSRGTALKRYHLLL